MYFKDGPLIDIKKNVKGNIFLNTSTFHNNSAFPLLNIDGSCKIIIENTSFAFHTMTCFILSNIQNIQIYDTKIYGCQSQTGVSGVLIQSSWKDLNINYSVEIID